MQNGGGVQSSRGRASGATGVGMSQGGPGGGRLAGCSGGGVGTGLETQVLERREPGSEEDKVGLAGGRVSAGTDIHKAW